MVKPSSNTIIVDFILSNEYTLEVISEYYIVEDVEEEEYLSESTI